MMDGRTVTSQLSLPSTWFIASHSIEGWHPPASGPTGVKHCYRDPVRGRPTTPSFGACFLRGGLYRLLVGVAAGEDATRVLHHHGVDLRLADAALAQGRKHVVGDVQEVPVRRPLRP